MGIRDILVNDRLGFGTAPLGNMFRDIPDQEAEATVDAAWNHGTSGARASARAARAAPLRFSPLTTSPPCADLWFLNRLRGFQPALSTAGTRGRAAR